MTGLFKKIQTAVKNRTTYRTGLLQDKAYRILKSFTTEALTSYKISTVDWALLGLLYDRSEGEKPSVLASELGVEAPFVTVLVAGLVERGYLEVRKNTHDSRSKTIFLTKDGRLFVATVEKDLRTKIAPMIAGIPTSDLIAYLSVLEKIIENNN